MALLSGGRGPRRGWYPALLRLGCRPVATALICRLSWEFPYAAGAALKPRDESISNVLQFSVHCCSG